jgi:hypothetical protein
MPAPGNNERGQYLPLFFKRGQIIAIFALVHFMRAMVAPFQIKQKSNNEI